MVAMANPNWKSRTMWTGDNLDIMRGMNSECVDLIYLDPPFNSNRNYSAPIGSQAAGAAFKDTWTLSDLDVAWMGLIADKEPALYKVLGSAREASEPSMQSYLCMMAVRLMEMRRLLKVTGSIYLHCDSTASHYLKVLMDSIFGSRPTSVRKSSWKTDRMLTGLSSRSYAANTEESTIILLYLQPKTDDWILESSLVSDPLSSDYVKKFYRYS